MLAPGGRALALVQMPASSPFQVRNRERFEALIALMAPALDLVLSVGDRVSRALGPQDEYYPIRPPGEAFELPSAPPASSEADEPPA